MNSVFVLCEIDDANIADVSLELLNKGRSLANRLKCKLKPVVRIANWMELKEPFLWGRCCTYR